jgi:hypothetical protein
MAQSVPRPRKILCTAGAGDVIPTRGPRLLRTGVEGSGQVMRSGLDSRARVQGFSCGWDIATILRLRVANGATLR